MPEMSEQQKLERRKLERAIVATLLGDPTKYPHAAAKLRSEYFSDRLCRRIFFVQDELYHLENVEPSASNLLASGKLTHDESSQLTEVSLEEDRFNLPMLIHRLCEMEAGSRCKAAQDQADRQEDVFKRLATLREGLTAAESVIQGANRKTKSESIDGVLLRASERASGKRRPFATGFSTIDAMLEGGLSEGGLSFVGGYPGEGKTSFALAIAVHEARIGVQTEFLEGEMTEDEIHDRAARMFYGGDLVSWLKEYDKLPLEIVPMTDRSPGRLLAAVEYGVVKGARFLVVDYLQCFASQERETDRHYLAIKNLSAQLRGLLLRHAEKGSMVHIMALSNLNRTEAGSGRPGLFSLYGSSGLGHDCTEALMIYSDNTENARLQEAQTGHRAVTVELVKARKGQRGPVNFTFYGSSQIFSEGRAESFAGFTLAGGNGHG